MENDSHYREAEGEDGIVDGGTRVTCLSCSWVS